MITGFLVNPDLSHRVIEFELDQAAQFLGGVDQDRVAVSFQEDGSDYAALFNPTAKTHAAEPNPVASLARSAAATGDPAFLADPTTAISGPVIFVGAEGGDIGLDEIRRIKDGMRAVRNYREDNEVDYRLWRAAVLNLGQLRID
ncbi:hypothetical protein EAH68_04350 [Corynebacterium hylobatis]|uniref:Uncharacterized protein n=1 Tax=Corynebacterium hylobatis TaxID=1859290 RepID=A0A430HZR0_9CORY|nr:hypothetical protein [Corynebacterium hylobatis]RSZ64239.1 hypothetical protein EAH68_04350 [Corynebacterium hylobatis]